MRSSTISAVTQSAIRDALSAALLTHGGNITNAAKSLGICRRWAGLLVARYELADRAAALRAESRTSGPRRYTAQSSAQLDAPQNAVVPGT